MQHHKPPVRECGEGHMPGEGGRGGGGGGGGGCKAFKVRLRLLCPEWQADGALRLYIHG